LEQTVVITRSADRRALKLIRSVLAIAGPL
jgi:hypothetical protein